MAIAHIPASWPEAASWLDDYEARHLRPAPSTVAMGTALLSVLRDSLPGLARPVAGPVFAAIMGEPAVSLALGIRTPPAPVPQLVGRILRLAAAVGSLRPLAAPVFTPRAPAPPVYPAGYSLDQLGVDDSDARAG